jgi:hypothetical protein
LPTLASWTPRLWAAAFLGPARKAPWPPCAAAAAAAWGAPARSRGSCCWGLAGRTRCRTCMGAPTTSGAMGWVITTVGTVNGPQRGEGVCDTASLMLCGAAAHQPGSHLHQPSSHSPRALHCGAQQAGRVATHHSRVATHHSNRRHRPLAQPCHAAVQPQVWPLQPQVYRGSTERGAQCVPKVTWLGQAASLVLWQSGPE